ncbi:MAG TPA: hypothetical protein VFZ61_10725 [Polyangiales bacterium]
MPKRCRSPMRALGACAGLALTLVACVHSEPAKDYGDPTSLSLPSESAGITAWVESPASGRDVESAAPEVVLAAYTKDATPLEVSFAKLELDEDGRQTSLGAQPAEATGSPGPSQRFKARVGLTHGDNRVLARIATADRTQVRTLLFSLRYDGAGPGVSLGVSAPEANDAEACSDGSELSTPVTRRRSVCVHGRVSGGTASAVLRTSGGNVSVPLDGDGHFRLPVELAPNARSQLTLEAQGGGQTTSVPYVILQDETPPSIELTSGTGETTAAEINVAGKVADENGVAEVAIESERGGRDVIGATTQFDRSVRLVPGDNLLTIVARDNAGNEARKPVTLARVRVLHLGAARRNAGGTDIEVDRTALSELLGAEDQKTIDLAAIDLEPAVRATLARIREPERYGVDTSVWGAPERNLQRILRQTPDVADLSGTSVAELLRISSAVSLPAPRMLADLLNLRPTDYIVDLDVAAKVILDGLVATHPSMSRDAQGKPVLAISMYDVLQNLATIAPRFAALGGHPGFLTGESRGDVLEPGFLLTFPVTSNLTQVDAIDLSRRSKDFLFLLEGERVLDFNVLTDDFDVVGLVDQPSMDLRFVMRESPTAPRAGNTQNAGADAADPGFYRGNGGGFALPPYLFEHIAAEIGYRQLHRAFAEQNFQRENRYDAGSIKDAAVIGWSRGWVSIRTAGGLGAPPPPLYAWDLLMEVAQARRHDGVPEGMGDMAFALEKLPIGLSADQLIEKLRPKLAEQETKLSELLVGNSGLASSAADVFYLRNEQGQGALVYRGPNDGGEARTYPKPGFFSDAGLTQKVSTTAAAFGLADTTHEKAAATQGAVYYVADESGAAFELKVSEQTADGIGVEVRKLGGTP